MYVGDRRLGLGLGSGAYGSKISVQNDEIHHPEGGVAYASVRLSYGYTGHNSTVNWLPLATTNSLL